MTKPAAVMISCPTITLRPLAKSITLPNGLRVLPQQVKNSALGLTGGDCAMQEINSARQRSGFNHEYTIEEAAK